MEGEKEAIARDPGNRTVVTLVVCGLARSFYLEGQLTPD